MIELQERLQTFIDQINTTVKYVKYESRRPCKIQCTFYCHRVVKIIAPLFVYVRPQPLGSKWPQRTQLSDGVGC